MKAIIIMLQSLNGKVAISNNDPLLWGGKADKKNFSELTKAIGTMIMGSGTFKAMKMKPLPGRRTIVLTRSPQLLESEYKKSENGHKAQNAQQDTFVEFRDSSPAQILAELEQENFDQVAVVGGPQILTSFLSKNLIAEIWITIAPVLFSSEINILNQLESKVDLELIEIQKLDKNTIFLKYMVNNHLPSTRT